LREREREEKKMEVEMVERESARCALKYQVERGRPVCLPMGTARERERERL